MSFVRDFVFENYNLGNRAGVVVFYMVFGNVEGGWCGVFRCCLVFNGRVRSFLLYVREGEVFIYFTIVYYL